MEGHGGMQLNASFAHVHEHLHDQSSPAKLQQANMCMPASSAKAPLKASGKISNAQPSAHAGDVCAAMILGEQHVQAVPHLK